MLDGVVLRRVECFSHDALQRLSVALDLVGTSRIVQVQVGVALRPS